MSVMSGVELEMGFRNYCFLNRSFNCLLLRNRSSLFGEVTLSFIVFLPKFD